MEYDVIIIGGGIAGITAALYLKQANKKVLLIEKSMYGGSLNKISTIKNFPGFSNIMGPELAMNLYKQLKDLDIEIKNATVLDIINGDKKIVKLEEQDLLAKYVIIATGKEPRKLNLENENKLVGKGLSYCALCDAFFFKNKDVAVIGSGESALKEALYLSDICKNVTIINKYDKFKSKDNILNEILKKNNINILYNSLTKSLNEENGYLKSITYLKDKQEEKLIVSGAFIYIGSTPNIFSKLNLEDDKSYIIVNSKQETSIKDIYAVGDVTKKDVYQLINASSEGMIAATDIIKKINKSV